MLATASGRFREDATGDGFQRRRSMSTVKALRELRGWTADQLAARIGVRPEVVHAWETLRSSPNDRQIAMLARIFGVSPNAIGDATTITRPDRGQPGPATPAQREASASAQ